MLERRKLLKAAIAAPVIGSLSVAGIQKEESPIEPIFKARKMMMGPFPSKIVSFVNFRDRLFVATECDGVYEITGE